MNRRGFFGLLASLPFVGKLVAPVVPIVDRGRVFYVDSDSIVADKAYFASRVEVLPGTGFRMYDINSSYPACMMFRPPLAELMEARGYTRPQKIALLNRLYGKHGVL